MSTNKIDDRVFLDDSVAQALEQFMHDKGRAHAVSSVMKLVKLIDEYAKNEEVRRAMLEGVVVGLETAAAALRKDLI